MRQFCTLGLIGLAPILIACSQPNASAQQSAMRTETHLDAQKLTIATADASGAYTTIGQALAQIYQEQFSIPVSHKTTTGSAENLRLLKEHKVDLALVMSDTLADAIQGKNEFKQPLSQIVHIASLYPSYVQVIVPSHSTLQHLADFKNKRIAVSAQSSNTETNAKRLLASAGLKRNDYKMWYFGHAEAIDAFKTGKIDAAILSGSIPNQVIQQLIQDGFSVRFIGIENTQFNQLKSQHPYFVTQTIPANSYGQHAAVPTVAVMHSLVARQDLSQHDVYALTQSFFQHLPRLQQAHPAAQAIQQNTAQQGLVYALHAGAIQYYQQKKP